MNDSVYAKPVVPRIVVRPALASLVLHVAVIALMTVNWSGGETEVVQVKPVPKVINARLVDVSEFRPKPKPKPKPKPAAKTSKKPKAVAKATPKPKPKPAPVAKPKPAPAPREEVAPEPAEEMAASYAALIQQTVVNYWSRPPSARNGMEALLAIQLIPTGEVVSVSVLKSSGSTAFDRSAINAVEKVGAFPELQKLPPREFEKTFRRFRLLFRPEDLRY